MGTRKYDAEDMVMLDFCTEVPSPLEERTCGCKWHIVVLSSWGVRSMTIATGN